VVRRIRIAEPRWVNLSERYRRVGFGVDFEPLSAVEVYFQVPLTWCSVLPGAAECGRGGSIDKTGKVITNGRWGVVNAGTAWCKGSPDQTQIRT
jgi:hypothetical protein